jgi:hypothetical protein
VTAALGAEDDRTRSFGNVLALLAVEEAPAMADIAVWTGPRDGVGRVPARNLAPEISGRRCLGPGRRNGDAVVCAGEIHKISEEIRVRAGRRDGSAVVTYRPPANRVQLLHGRRA